MHEQLQFRMIIQYVTFKPYTHARTIVYSNDHYVNRYILATIANESCNNNDNKLFKCLNKIEYRRQLFIPSFEAMLELYELILPEKNTGPKIEEGKKRMCIFFIIVIRIVQQTHSGEERCIIQIK